MPVLFPEKLLPRLAKTNPQRRSGSSTARHKKQKLSGWNRTPNGRKTHIFIISCLFKNVTIFWVFISIFRYFTVFFIISLFRQLKAQIDVSQTALKKQSKSFSRLEILHLLKRIQVRSWFISSRAFSITHVVRIGSR